MAMLPTANPTSRAGLAPTEAPSSAPIYASFALPASLAAALQAAPQMQPTVQQQAINQPMAQPTANTFDLRAGQQGFADGGPVPQPLSPAELQQRMQLLSGATQGANIAPLQYGLPGGTQFNGQFVQSGPYVEAGGNLAFPLGPGQASIGGSYGRAIGSNDPANFSVRGGYSMPFADGGIVPSAPGMMPPGAGVAPAPAPSTPTGTPPQSVVPADQLQAEIQRFMQQNPQQVQQIQQVIMEALQSGQLSMQDLNIAVQMAVAAAQNPALYPRLRSMAIQRGLAEEQDLPQQYDQGIVFALLIAGAAVQRVAGGQSMAEPQAPQAPVAQMAMGGKIPPGASPHGDNTGRMDDIPIRVSGGEYVIPKHVVDAKGSDFFDQMLEKYKR